MPLPLSKLHHPSAQHLVDSGIEVLHVDSSHALTQAAGYLKYNRARDYGRAVFFRGQTRLHPTLGPSLLRGIKDPQAAFNRRALLKDFLTAVDQHKAAPLRAVSPDCREALLQHYGIHTTWLDVVDNVWVALWFACHHARVAPWPNGYLHFEKRVPRMGGGPEYCYVLLVESAYFTPVPDQPGRYRNDTSETIDLRVAVPSQFVRPHAQHGVLVRRLSKKRGLPHLDFFPLVAGVIRVTLEDALDWLGSATTLTSHSLFPPAFYDYGYRGLLAHVEPADRTLGSIHRVQP
ncbi:FRG domain-containing protein [Anaeromyxobacter sp. SG66]|uniref:FRG domain-containing protein n=1 Tax=Anaeromyxobacter sp. SG66 TaxID=2925410 RepID=UPI001F56321D|nr:FRG domain-containing protein [Anaeromyxobacter sp. SG66]